MSDFAKLKKRSTSPLARAMGTLHSCFWEGLFLWIDLPATRMSSRIGDVATAHTWGSAIAEVSHEAAEHIKERNHAKTKVGRFLGTGLQVGMMAAGATAPVWAPIAGISLTR